MRVDAMLIWHMATLQCVSLTYLSEIFCAPFLLAPISISWFICRMGHHACNSALSERKTLDAQQIKLFACPKHSSSPSDTDPLVCLKTLFVNDCEPGQEPSCELQSPQTGSQCIHHAWLLRLSTPPDLKTVLCQNRSNRCAQTSGMH